MAGAVFRWVLPVSGRTASLRPMDGHDEMLLLEAQGPEPARAIELLDRLGDGDLDAASLPVTDVDALLLLLRRALLGDRVVTETACPSPACAAPVDIAFGIAAFLAHHRPRPPRLRGWRVARCPDQEGWFTLARADAESARFRPPSAGDEREVVAAPGGEDILVRRCLMPLPAAPDIRRAAEGAMAALAPSLAGPLHAVCPHCGATAAVQFDPRRYVLAELAARARFVMEDLHALAARYHWSEHAILALPSYRRIAYADLARRAA